MLMKMKKTLLVLLSIPFAFSCTNSNVSSSSSSYNQIIYNEEPDYSYSLVDDDRYGKAIYPNDAFIKLKEIEAYNRENGNFYFEDTIYNSKYSKMSIEGPMMVDYVIEEEHFIPDFYYYYEKNYYFMKQVATGFFYDDYENPDEFFYGEYSNDTDGDKYYTLSSLDDMNEYIETNRQADNHYNHFVAISDKIARQQLQDIVQPEDIKCYTKGEGSLFINIYRNMSLNGVPYRQIYRIVYDNYVPIQCTYQTVYGILGDADYYNGGEVVTFSYGEVELENCLSRFKNRRD